jgi:NAD(P)-dependent dehydrogenase (short-subunit alcohol dehydrogenase family)
MDDPPSFRDKVVIVTGGATGLGFAIAEAFGRGGATVAVNDLTTERAKQACAELAGHGIACRGYVADVRDADAVNGMIDAVRSELGMPDIVVANAGLYPNTPFLELREDEWDRVMDTNVKGVFLVCQAAARAMVAAKHAGQLIVLSSGAANRAIWGWSHYCASKAAVLILAKAMALELGEHGIRVNAVLPGYIDVDEGGAHLAESYRQAARTGIPLGRPGTPADVANAVLLLASPLSAFISGAAMTVDGGASSGPAALRPMGLPSTDP